MNTSRALRRITIRQTPGGRFRQFLQVIKISLIGEAGLIFLFCLSLGAASAQDGQYGHGHAKWHESFYNKLIRKDTKTSCCNLSDCRPSEVRTNGDHYEVKVDGAWVSVPQNAIQNVTAPDGGAHVCAPKQYNTNKGVIYCVVLPTET